MLRKELDIPHNIIMKQDLFRYFLYSFLIFFVLYFFVPLFVMLNTSFKSLEDIRSGNLLSLPKEFSLAAWFKAWEFVKDHFSNSFKMAIPSVLISVFIGSLNGYVLSKWKFKYSDLIFLFLLLGCFLPFQTILLPMAKTLGFLGISGTIAGLVLVHIIYGIPFTTLFFRNYYTSIPDELVQAAKIDGAGFFRIFWSLMLPISLPIFVVSIIWQFTQIWNDFLFGVVYSSSDSQPITVALNNIVNTTTSVKEYNVDMAAAFIAALPTLLIYILSGKYFVRGLTSGAVKG